MTHPFPLRARPLWLASYPRSGNTFLRIILEKIFQLPTWSVYRVEGQDFRDPSAEPLEQAPLLPADWRSRLCTSPDAELVIIKTHDLPEDEGAAICLVRAGCAAVHSYFHYHQKFSFEQPSLTEIIAGACQFGTWSGHYLGWQPRTRANTLLLKYEDLVARPESVIPVLAQLLERAPTGADLPSFAELKAKFPAFFRRGQNQDFLTEWSPAQLALFNHLHGAVMTELGYPLPATKESSAALVREVAASAEKLHKLYLHELQKQRIYISLQDQLSSEVKQLTRQVNALTEAVSSQKQEVASQKAIVTMLLANRWIKMGRALRFVPPARSGNGAEHRQPIDCVL